MQYPYPDRLISSSEKVRKLIEAICDNCYLLRRCENGYILNTIGGEIDPNIWSLRDIFGLSCNILICDQNFENNSEISDVNIRVIDPKDNYFESNGYTDSINPSEIEWEITDYPIIKIKSSLIYQLNGTYPFKRPSGEEIFYEYKVTIVHKPFNFNLFHMEIHVLTNQHGDWSNINREKANKGYLRSLATDIRSQIIESKLVTQVR